MHWLRESLGNGRKLRTPALVDDDQLARLDVAQIAGADYVERDGFGGKDGRFAKFAHDQRPDAERVAAGNQALGGRANQRVGAFDLAQARR